MANEQGNTRADDLLPKAVGFPGRKNTAVTFFIRIRHGDQIRLSIVGHNIHDLYLEHLAHFLADKLVYGMQIHFGCQPSLHTVNDFYFRAKLFCLFACFGKFFVYFCNLVREFDDRFINGRDCVPFLNLMDASFFFLSPQLVNDSFLRRLRCRHTRPPC